MNKEGRNELESAISLIFGVIVIFLILTSGIVSSVFETFSVFGALGALLGFLFILMIIISVWEAFTKK